jgi:tRNA(fMet)-specific endonuclease VapC
LSFLLDTDVCSAVIRGRPEAARLRLRAAIAQGDPIFTSGIVVFELWYGASRSAQARVHEARIESLLSQLRALPFDADDAREAGVVRATLEAAGKPIGAYDVLIAGQARRRGLTLATGNIREFSRVPSLDLEDWLN